MFRLAARSLLFILFSMVCLASYGQAEEKPKWNEPPLEELQRSLSRLLHRQYPRLEQDDSKQGEGTLRWDWNTRKFMVHLPSLTGKWQDASEMEGPNREGILCTAQIHKGQYQGMAVAPQTFERFYFKVLMMTPYRKDIDAHVVVRLYYPPGVDPKFLTEFTTKGNQFSADEPVEK